MEGFLRTIGQFISLNETEKDLFQKIVTVQPLTKNSFFIREGQICSRIAFVESGMLRHFYYTDKNDVTRWVSLKNTFSTSFASFIKETPSHENIQAIQDSVILTISKMDWQKLCDQYPTIHEIWVKNIESLYIGMEERVV